MPSVSVPFMSSVINFAVNIQVPEESRENLEAPRLEESAGLQEVGENQVCRCVEDQLFCFFGSGGG